MKLAEIEKKLGVIETKRQALRAAQAKALGRKYVTCTSSWGSMGCGRRTQIQNLTYFQTHFYVSPHGCNGGDYWSEGEGQFDCPKCGCRNRLYNRPAIMELKPYFNSVENVHDR